MPGIGLSITHAAAPPSFVELNMLAATLDARVTFARASTKTYIGSDGLRHTANANECPLEYDPSTLLPLGRSFWEARTNLLLNADTLATQSVTTTATTYTLAFEGTGSVTLSGSASGTLAGTGASPSNRVVLTFTASAGTLTLTVTGAVNNAQLEAAASASPYIPTTSTAVTRPADVATVTDLSTIRFSATEGTLYVESYLTNTIGNKVSASLSDGTTNNRLEIRTNGSTNELIDVAGGTLQAQPGFGGAQIGLVKAAAAWGGGNACFATGGSVTSHLTTASVPTCTTLSIGSRSPATGGVYNAAIRRIRYYPHRQADAQLQAMTA